MSESRPEIKLATFVLDTDDIAGLADFYTKLLGWEILFSDEDWITISGGDGARMAFQLALNHRRPTWPDNSIPQQAHLDLRVKDMAETQAYAESIGATLAEGPERHADFTVMLDPSGHPFCLCL